jgi:hypothetical protein
MGITAPLSTEDTRSPVLLISEDSSEDALLRETVDHYFRNLGATTWGGHGWDVTDEKERKLAVDWVLRLLSALPQHVVGAA